MRGEALQGGHACARHLSRGRPWRAQACPPYGADAVVLRDRYAALLSFLINSSRSARRRIFPTGVFGSSSRNSMIFGRL
jgi:hypothetical protein